MNAVVWKYPIPGEAPMGFTLEIPAGARMLTAELQKGKPVMWALVDPRRPKVKRSFLLLETGCGWSQPGILRYIATFQFDQGTYILHLFELIEI